MVVETAIPAENLADVSTIDPPIATKRPVSVQNTKAVVESKNSSAGRFVVQVASFSARSNADKAIALFEDSQPVRSQRAAKNGGGWLYRVRLGPFATKQEAEAALSEAKSEGFTDARIVQL
ncbi:MAG: SPOR domain-containing protein [Aquisalinus sp.]|nr:SPOR domain-containing protein [Aquisalinus sp.]